MRLYYTQGQELFASNTNPSEGMFYSKEIDLSWLYDCSDIIPRPVLFVRVASQVLSYALIAHVQTL